MNDLVYQCTTCKSTFTEPNLEPYGMQCPLLHGGFHDLVLLPSGAPVIRSKKESHEDLYGLIEAIERLDVCKHAADVMIAMVPFRNAEKYPELAELFEEKSG